jgi:hypothetical protein
VRVRGSRAVACPRPSQPRAPKDYIRVQGMPAGQPIPDPVSAHDGRPRTGHGSCGHTMGDRSSGGGELRVERGGTEGRKVGDVVSVCVCM